VIGIILLITGFFGWQMRNVKLNNSIQELLPADHSSVAQDKELKQVFNSREMILIGLVREDGIFNPETLQKVKDITEGAWQITVVEPDDVATLGDWGQLLGGRYAQLTSQILSDGLTAADRGAVNNLVIDAKSRGDVPSEFVSFLEELRLELSPLSDVLSIASVDNIASSDFGSDVNPPMADVPRTREELGALVATMYENEMFVNLVVSPDSTGTLILAELAFDYDTHLAMAARVFDELEALVSPYGNPDEIQLAGVPMVNVYTTSYMSGDLVKLTPLVLVLVMAVMFLSFRMLKGVLIPVSVVLAALVWTLGIMGLVGRPITLIVAFMPVMLIAIGIADGIHLITEYKLLWNEYRDHDKAILGTMRQLTMPVVFTSLTTMAGFAALTTSPLRSIKDFGIFTTIGVFAAMVFSLTFVPAALKLLRPPGYPLDSQTRDSDPLRVALEWFGDFAIRRRRWIYLGSIALVAIGAIAISQIEVGSTMVGLFKRDSAIYRASRTINEKFGGIEVMNIVVDTKTTDGLKDPVVLGKIAALQDTLETLPVVGYTTSLADYVRRTNLVMNDNDHAFDRIPRETEIVTETDWIEDDGKEVAVDLQVEISGRDLISQYLLLYENAGGDDLEKLADFDYSKANIVVVISDDFTPELRNVMQVAQRFAESNFASDITVTFAGCSTLCVVADDLIIPSQIRSLGIALGIVLLLLTFIFGSLRYGFLALSPMVLTVLLVFTLLGALGVYLDAGTALVASIVLGIGVDYSVHFLSRYRSLRRRGSDLRDAVRHTMDTSGRAIVFNSLAVALGFLVLTLSSFWPVIHIGWLVSTNMILSAILTMSLIPALLGSFAGHRRPEPFQFSLSRPTAGAKGVE
jgi:predicted RND superfamily exporter protein